jgi:dihydrofolate synthase/folylpolyglutamate synthase
VDYQTALDYILSFADYERMPRSALVFDLRRIGMLLERLGSPQETAKSIHIAGTKGKGSTAAMIASILTQAGYRVGLYTSPHLLSIAERIQVDGRAIDGDAFARLVEVMKPEVEAVNASGALGELTTFELLTALAFAYFKEREVDYQVMEVGLGGRLDATNVVKPEVCVITSISFDHTDVLGDTLAQIATEKAGIIKSGSTVVCSPQAPEAMGVIERVCREREAKLIQVGGEITWRRKGFSPEGQSCQLNGNNRRIQPYPASAW